MKMIIKIAIFALSMTALCVLAKTDNEKIAWIKQEYKVTRTNLYKYKVQEFDFSGESAEGAGGVGYLSDTGKIRLIEVTYYGETGKAYYEFYYSENKTIFILKTDYIYNTHFMMTEELVKEWYEEDGVVLEAFDQDKTKVEEWRYYFYDNEPIRTLGPTGTEISDLSHAESAFEDSLSNYERVNKLILAMPKNDTME